MVDAGTCVRGVVAAQYALQQVLDGRALARLPVDGGGLREQAAEHGLRVILDRLLFAAQADGLADEDAR